MATIAPTGEANDIGDAPMGLIDLCDEVSLAKHLISCVFLACQQMAARDERAALCSVANAAREKLEAVEAALQLILRGRARGRGE